MSSYIPDLDYCCFNLKIGSRRQLNSAHSELRETEYDNRKPVVRKNATC